MAAYDFPDAPTNGQVYDKWTWNGTMWKLTAGAGGGGGSGFTFSQDAMPTATAIGNTWYQTSTGDSFVWTNDGNSTQWVQFAPGSGGGGGSGFTYVQETAPTPSKVGDTWFDLSTAATGGTSWVAVEESPGGEKVWVQFAPGTGAGLGPRGALVLGRRTTDAQIGQAEIDIMSVTFNADPTRWYKYTFTCWSIGSINAASGVYVYFTDTANASKGHWRFDPMAAGQAVGMTLIQVEGSLSGSITRKIRARLTTNTNFIMGGDTTVPMTFLVEDIGASLS